MPKVVPDFLLGTELLHDHTPELDPRYVNVTGDTMTGTLQINVPTATSEALIIKTTDDDATKNLFEVKRVDDSNIFSISPDVKTILNDGTSQLETYIDGVSSENLIFCFSKRTTIFNTSNTTGDFTTQIKPAIGSTSKGGRLEIYRTLGSSTFVLSGSLVQQTTLEGNAGFVLLTSNTNTQPIELRTYNGSVGYIAFSPRGAEVMRISADKLVGIYETTPGASLQVNAATSSTIATIIKASPSQTANLTEWQNSSGSNLTSIKSQGSVLSLITSDASTTYAGLLRNTTSTDTTDLSGLQGQIFVNANNTTAGISSSMPSASKGGYELRANKTAVSIGGYVLSGTVRDGSTLTNAVGLYVQDPSLDGSGTVANTYGLYIDNHTVGSTLNYSIYTNAGKVRLGDDVLIEASSASNVPLTVKAAPSQTANLTEWQDSSGNVLSGVDERGILFSYGGTDEDNFFAGNNAGNNAATGLANNVGIGTDALSSLTDGYHNTGVGYQALKSVTSGDYNTAFGYRSLLNVTDGTNNVAFGPRTLEMLTDGARNSAFGTVLQDLEIGNDNNAFGTSALSSIVSGSNNNAFGNYVLTYSTGISNTGFGHTAMQRLVGGNNNVAIGTGTGRGQTGATFSNNTLIGYQSGNVLTTGSSNILLGYLAGSQLTTESNLLYIANSNTTTPLIYGEFDTPLLTINGTLRTASNREFKTSEIDNTDSPYTAGDEEVILCDTTTADITVNLPAVSGITGRNYYIKNVGTGAVTLSPSGAETIDGATTLVISLKYDSPQIVAGSTEWSII